MARERISQKNWERPANGEVQLLTNGMWELKLSWEDATAVAAEDMQREGERAYLPSQSHFN